MTQWFTLYADSDQLEVRVRLDLCEQHRMIKICLPTIMEDAKEISEIAFGALQRSACGNEEHCQRWVALEGKGFGLAVLNNGKYSYSAQEGELRLTAANTSIFADHYGQSYRDDSCLFMDQGVQEFRYVLYPFTGTWQKAQLQHRASLLNQCLPRVVETYHKGPLPPSYQGLEVDNPALSLSALKRAEDEKGYVIRLQNTSDQSQSAQLHLPLLKRELTLELRPWEIRSCYLPDDANLPVRDVLLTEFDR